MKRPPIDPKAAALLQRIARRERVSVEELLRRAFSTRTPAAPREISVRIQIASGQRKALQRGAKLAGVTPERLAEFIDEEAWLNYDAAFIEEGGQVLRGRLTPNTRTSEEMIADIRRADEAMMAKARADRRARGELKLNLNARTYGAIEKAAAVAKTSPAKMVRFILQSMEHDIFVESGKLCPREAGRRSRPLAEMMPAFLGSKKPGHLSRRPRDKCPNPTGTKKSSKKE